MSRICGEIDEYVAVFGTRSLEHLAFRYVFVDATYVKARIDHHIVSRAVIVATGVAADGNREVLGLDVGDSEDEVFWTQFLRSLRDRGLRGVNLVISDAHSGLKARDLEGVPRHHVATLSGASHAQPAGPCPQGSQGDDRRHCEDDLCPTRNPPGISCVRSSACLS